MPSMAGSRACALPSLPQQARFRHLAALMPRRQPTSRPVLASCQARRYNPGMRRPTRLSLAAVVLLIAVFGAYSAFWFVAAGRLEDGVGQWAASLRAQNLGLSLRTIRVGRFPLGVS